MKQTKIIERKKARKKEWKKEKDKKRKKKKLFKIAFLGCLSHLTRWGFSWDFPPTPYLCGRCTPPHIGCYFPTRCDIVVADLPVHHRLVLPTFSLTSALWRWSCYCQCVCLRWWSPHGQVWWIYRTSFTLFVIPIYCMSLVCARIHIKNTK